MRMKHDIVIIDIGSYSTKVGYAGEDIPQVIIPTMVSTKKDVFRTDYDMLDNSHLEQIEFEKRALGYHTYKHLYPVNKGKIEQWWAVEELLNYVFQKKLNINPVEYCVFIVGPLFNFKADKQRMLDMIFNKFSFKAGYIGLLGPLLGLHALESQSGLIIDTGTAKIDVIPVIDQKLIISAVQRLNFGGYTLSLYLRKLIREDKGAYTKILNLRDRKGVLEDMVKDLCYVALNFKEEINRAEDNLELKKSFKIPETAELLSFDTERFVVPEAIFHPKTIGVEDESLPILIQRSIESFDHKIQNILVRNIVLIGGLAQMPGLKERIMKELRNLLSKEFKIQITTPPNSLYSIWVGSAKFASKLSSNDWITKEGYLKKR